MEQLAKSINHQPISRRTFLRTSLALTGLAALASGCERKPLPQRISPSSPKLPPVAEPGTYLNESEIKRLAQNMQKDPELENVQYAGKLLEGNSNSQPTISKTSLMFTETLLRIKSMPYVRKNWRPGEDDIPAYMLVAGKQVNEQYDLKTKTSGTVLTARGAQFFIDHIALSDVHMPPNRWEDFKAQFYVAKEILNIPAFEMLGKYLAEAKVYPKYEPPADPKARGLLQADLVMRAKIDNATAVDIADIWAHFILIPDYLNATEKQKWTRQTAESNEMSIFFHAAERFKKENILMQSNGIYQWTPNTGKLYDSWMETALEQ